MKEGKELSSDDALFRIGNALAMLSPTKTSDDGQLEEFCFAIAIYGVAERPRVLRTQRRTSDSVVSVTQNLYHHAA